MKKTVAALALVALSTSAHAVDFEVGLGGAHITDMGDGTWVQRGAPNNRERQNTPAYMLGVTGTVYDGGAWDARWHLDYTYIGKFSASVDGVPDANYDAVHHRVVNMPAGMRYSPFNGQGHVQGVPLALDLGYTWHGYRLGAEAGAWVYWQTWHESLYNLADQWQDLSHKTHAQVGWVAGANIERGPFALSYRYYSVSQSWNPYPGLASGAHVLMATYKW